MVSVNDAIVKLFLILKICLIAWREFSVEKIAGLLDEPY